MTASYDLTLVVDVPPSVYACFQRLERWWSRTHTGRIGFGPGGLGSHRSMRFGSSGPETSWVGFALVMCWSCIAWSWDTR